MANGLIVIITFAAFVLLLSLVNIYIDVHFCRRKDNDYIGVTVYLLRRLLTYSIKIPVIEIVRHNNVPWLSSEINVPKNDIKTKVGREQRFVMKMTKKLIKDPQKIRRLYKIAQDYLRDYKRFVGKIAEGTHCERLEIKAVYGFEDAALTGLSMGVLGAIKGIFLTSIHNRIEFDASPNISVQPLFGQSHFEIELRCILRIRVGNVITATMAIFKKSSHREAT